MGPAPVKPKSMRSRNRRQRRRRQIAYLAICGLSVVLFGIALTTLIRPATAQDPNAGFRPGFEGHGTTHEQMGQPHFVTCNYTDYTSVANYSEAINKSTSMNPIFDMIHKIYDNILTTNDPIPPGYIDVVNGDTLSLGPKVETNDWRDLLYHYWLVLILILIFVILIVIVPFIAVCYCCFCCCRRCRQGCPPCTSKQDAQRRFCCGICLLALIIGLIFGIIIAFATNKMVDDGLSVTSKTMSRGAADTCTYLRDVSDHIYHLMVYNYEEFETQTKNELRMAENHIFLDLADTSQAITVSDLERILKNMPKALAKFNEFEVLEKELRFLTAQLRDGLRGLKRDINWAIVYYCQEPACQQILLKTKMEFMDTSECLHLEFLPSNEPFIEGVKEIIKANYVLIPQSAQARLLQLRERIKEKLDPIVAAMTEDVNKGKLTFKSLATQIRNKVDAVTSDIYLNTYNSAKSFEDVYERFGPNRSYVSLIACLLILLVLVMLIVALMCGCFGRRRTGYGDECCSKSTGATCLLLAILLIFCVFSFLALVGIFYFIIGLVTYQGACAPLRNRENNTFFEKLDSSINLNKYLPQVDRDSEDMPPMPMSRAILACHTNVTIFEVMRQNSIYDIKALEQVRIFVTNATESTKNTTEPPVFLLMEGGERVQMTTLLNSTLAPYHSSLWRNALCTDYSPISLEELSKILMELSSSLRYSLSYAQVAFENQAIVATKLYRNFESKMKVLPKRMLNILKEIDNLILYNNHKFGDTIEKLSTMTFHAEDFIRINGAKFVDVLLENLTDTIHDNFDDYVDRVVDEALTKVGNCAPLAYIYYSGVDFICNNLSDPINGFWVGILLCALLMLPILIVAHKLMCLYKKVYPYVAAVGAAGVVAGGSDYLYDAYSERDRDREHVPLANVPKKRRKAYERRREQQEYYEDASPSVARNRSGGDRGGDRGRDDVPGSSNMRYNDMAPT
ncbi:hypothetical protein KR009_005114 [Drosophila setifemur]|nr:hypothetical protein KR009_005114 [Drosophila setifemur]